MIKIILADDHDVVLTGMKLLIESQVDMKVIGQGKNGQEVLTLLERAEIPDILISDLNMPGMNGLDLTKQVKALYPNIKILIVSMINDLSYLMKAFQNGATGYLLKTVDYEEMFFGIRQIIKGSHFLCAQMTLIVVKYLEKFPTVFLDTNQIIKDSGLTEREVEILQLISEGLNNAEIADKLFISKRTVEGHRQSLLEKSASKNTASLIKYAVNYGIIS